MILGLVVIIVILCYAIVLQRQVIKRQREDFWNALQDKHNDDN
jgi:hypothetical protein